MGKHKSFNVEWDTFKRKILPRAEQAQLYLRTIMKTKIEIYTT